MEGVSRDLRERANLRDALLKLNRGNQVDKESRKVGKHTSRGVTLHGCQSRASSGDFLARAKDWRHFVSWDAFTSAALQSKVIAAALAREAAAGAVARGDWEEWRRSTAGMECEEETEGDVRAPVGPSQRSTPSESVGLDLWPQAPHP